MATNNHFEEILKDKRFADMVSAVAREYYRLSFQCNYRCYEEFESAALVGLWKAWMKREVGYGDAFLKFARNKMRWECADYLRTLVRRQRTVELLSVAGATRDEGFLEDYLPSSGPKVELLKDYYERNFNISELARREGVSRGVIKKQILAAIADVRETMEKVDAS